MFLSKWFTPKKDEGTFVEHKLKTMQERRKTTLLFLSAVAVIGWIYFFFGTTYFTVQRIQIEGLELLNRGEVEELVEEELQRQRQWPVRSGHLLTINTTKLKNALHERLFIDSVTVDKEYPNILRLSIEERQSWLILLLDNEFYEIDRYGVITNEYLNEEADEVLDRIYDNPVAQNTSVPVLQILDDAHMPVVGQEFVTAFRTTVWLDTFKVLDDLGFGYRNAILDYATSTKLVLNMYEPYDVYFDLLEPLEPQINGFYVFMKLKGEEAVIREYVDARVPNKVFYR
ncbi:FtsQ-type POTRA domain-containing protein [Candidatus Uhrbacteria bacterium]|nr:FtsQ-type POTRA domain-containing protein [Candidatus Uhrbacteria bacterium]